MFQLKEKSLIQSQMTEWIELVQAEYSKNNMVRNNDRCEMRADGIVLLMRCQTSGVEGLCLVIATVYLDESLQSRGWFKSFLKYCVAINPWDKVAIEDVNNIRLRNFFIDIGFKPVNNFFATSFIIDPEIVRNIEASPFTS